MSRRDWTPFSEAQQALVAKLNAEVDRAIMGIPVVVDDRVPRGVAFVFTDDGPRKRHGDPLIRFLTTWATSPNKAAIITGIL